MVYGCAPLIGRVECNCSCGSDKKWRASIKIVAQSFVYYTQDPPSFPKVHLLKEEMKHVKEDNIRLQMLRKEGPKIEAKQYPAKFLCLTECKIYEAWAYAMSLFSHLYTHLTDPHEY